MGAVDLLVLVAPLLFGQAPVLRVGQPLVTVHQRLLAQGWQVSLEAQEARPDDQQTLAIKKRLPSLISCSGTGAGYCAYGYSRQGEQLRLVSQGDGPLLRWQIGDSWFGSGVAAR